MGVIINPVSGVVDIGGPEVNGNDLSPTYNHAGLIPDYTSGVDDFDTYIASNPTHSAFYFALDFQEWFSMSGVHAGQVTYDLGSIMNISAMALWNEESGGIATLDLSSSTDNVIFTPIPGASGLLPTDHTLGSGPYGADPFYFTATSMRYIRLIITGPQDTAQPHIWDGWSIGEVAFRVHSVGEVTGGGGGPTTVRYIEKWALETECVGATLSKLADAFVVYSGAPTATLTGLSHLEGKAVVVWADGLDFSPDDPVTGVQRVYTVAGGAITLDSAVSNAVIGLPYTAQWKSAKLAYAAQLGTALTQRKRISALGLILVDAHAYGLKVGQDFALLDDLPLVRDDGETIDPNTVSAAEDDGSFPVNGTWDTDSRLCLQAKAPRCINVLAAIMTVAENDKA
jgi:hypothetical protein